jgi:hypothetical protein
LVVGYAGRASGFLTGKKGVFNPFSSVIRNYYFSSGRKVSNYYDLKEKNDQIYKEIIPNEKGKVIRKAPLTEKLKVKRIKNQTDAISDLLSDYRKLDIEKEPETAARLRDKILIQLEKLDAIIEKNKISFNPFKVRVAEAAESKALAFTGTPRQEQVYDQLKSGYRTGEASYYNPTNPSETREGTTGVGAYGRSVESGSVAFGNRVFHDALKKGEIIYIKVKGFEDIKTPYGNGVFRIDDTMNQRFSKQGQFNIDFNASDLDKARKSKGRYPIEFKIVEPETKKKNLQKNYYA